MKFANDGQEYLSYNDVLLQPQASDLNSRYDSRISLATQLTLNPKSTLDLPIISANMDTVTGSSMASVMNKHGGLGIFHRYYSNQNEELEDYAKMMACRQVGFSIGITTSETHIKNVIDTFNSTYNDDPFIYICLDVAHGHMQQTAEKTNQVRHLITKMGWDNVDLIAGNVATPEGTSELAKAGANIIKVGVGPGSMCSTRTVTAHGVPQLSAIEECRAVLDENNWPVSIIADGGIKHTGDIVKALAAGANAVMVGNLFAGTDEAPGEIIQHPYEPKMKMYRGQSSRSFMTDNDKHGRAAEGETSFVIYKGGMNSVLEEMEGGIRSGFTYSGAKTIEELQEKAIFVRITQNGWNESKPHGI